MIRGRVSQLGQALVALDIMDSEGCALRLQSSAGWRTMHHTRCIAGQASYPLGPMLAMASLVKYYGTLWKHRCESAVNPGGSA